MTRKSPIKVLIVDDSAVVRSMLTRVLSNESDITVVGGAPHPYAARELILKDRPDVVILDIEMPRMDGLTFLRKLMKHFPLPVIMCSGVAPANSRAALDAIEAGAIDVVAKPSTGGSKALARLGMELADKVRAAAIAGTGRSAPRIAPTAAPASFRAVGLDPHRYLVTIGASTGGTEAIKELLSHVPADFPAVAMVQHMPEGFTRSFAERLNQFSALTVSEAVDGESLEPGKALLARGGVQMAVIGTAGHWRIRYGDDEPVNRHCPSVDVLFDSAAKRAGGRTVGVLLTGMGADGAKGLLNLRRAGATTVAQDEGSCVVYGMPKVAADLGAAQHTASPAQIPSLLLRALKRGSVKRKTSVRRPSPVTPRV